MPEPGAAHQEPWEHRMSFRAAAATAAVLLALVPAAPGHADTPAPAPGEGEGLFLTVSGGDDSWIRGVRLRCAPRPTGPHRDPEGACAALHTARGDLDRLRGDQHPCTKRFDPVTARATGEWRGITLDWRRTYPNACVLDTETGPVFRF
ncbi:SSI family serine proteinase inhibitor [Streptomyces sp. NPDC015131]|uniref:SSI family serine proteinase inhibitor n=1 Tax=Streptomyces sp. NPDC015131 TaxID=3364941 RepID=UPI0036FE951A